MGRYRATDSRTARYDKKFLHETYRSVGPSTHIEFDVFQCTVKDLVQSLTVDSRTVSKHMSRMSVRHDVILAQDAPPRIVDVDAARRRAAAADGDEEKNRRQPGNPKRSSNSSTMAEKCKPAKN